MRKIPAVLGLILVALPAMAAETDGALNPEELSIGHILDNVAKGHVDMMTCAAGYPLVKAGRHVEARRLFELCAENGYTAAMSWMSYLDANGAGGPENPKASVQWDRRAAEAGDPVGMYNLGLDMLRGYGTVRDTATARQWIDKAADKGLPSAVILKDSGYDPDVATPDADNWKYGAPSF